MEVDINEPISKFFNVFLRMFQLGCQLALAYWAIRIHEYSRDTCGHLFLDIASYIAYALIFINLVALCHNRCSQKFPRCFSFTIYILDIIMCAALIAKFLILKSDSKNLCAPDSVFSEFSSVQSIQAFIVTMVVLIANLGCGQRYTNAPGNIIWIPLMLGFVWSEQFHLPMLLIGIAQGVISMITLFTNLVTCSGPTVRTKKVLMGGWIFGLLLMVGCEVYAVLTYLQVGEMTDYKDIKAKKTLAIFIVVNILDFLFWLWGLKTLGYENGDPVRGQLYEPDEVAQNEYEGNNKSSQVAPYENRNTSQVRPERSTYNGRVSEKNQYGTIRY